MKCMLCGLDHADCWHHLLGGKTSNKKTGARAICEKYNLKVPLNNFDCHLQIVEKSKEFHFIKFLLRMGFIPEQIEKIKFLVKQKPIKSWSEDDKRFMDYDVKQYIVAWYQDHYEIEI